MFGFGNWGSGEQADDDAGLKPKTFDDYEKVVMDGLPQGERTRMSDAYANLRYANGHYDDLEAERNGRGPMTQTSELWDPIRPDGDDTRYDKTDFTLAQPVMRRIVGKLSENLYKRSPTRELADKSVSAVVNEIYKRNGMASKWASADRFTVVGGAAAWQFAGDEDPASPVKIHLWSADQAAVFTSPEDQTQVDAVVTIDRVDGRTRAKLWTEDRIGFYVVKRDETPAGSTRKFTKVWEKDNPYRLPDSADEQGRGIIPFSFCHFNPPDVEFTWDSPGNNLRELNRYINYGFDDLADGIRYLTKPIGVAEGVAADWEAPAVVRPGMFLNVAAGQVDAGGNGPQPKLSYLGADNAFVAVIWSHLNNYLDLAMELEGVPPSTVRMVLDARSGVSILAEQAPLLGWTECRRRPFAHYELCAIQRLLQITSAHLRNHGQDSARFDAAALDPGLALHWPRLYVDLPGPERDRADGTRLQWGLVSLLDIVQERDDCTREQALDTLKRVKADNDELTAAGIPALPAVLQATGQGQQGGGWGQPQLSGPGGGGEPGTGADSSLDQLASGGHAPGAPGDVAGAADSLSGEGG